MTPFSAFFTLCCLYKQSAKKAIANPFNIKENYTLALKYEIFISIYNINRTLHDILRHEYYLHVSKTKLTYSLLSFLQYCFYYSKIKVISSHRFVIIQNSKTMGQSTILLRYPHCYINCKICISFARNISRVTPSSANFLILYMVYYTSGGRIIGKKSIFKPPNSNTRKTCHVSWVRTH